MIQSTTKKPTHWPSTSTITNISEHQRQTLSKSLSTRIGVLGGTPGTGKTHTTIALIKAIADKYGPHMIAFAAPTGKAANRGAELLSSNNLTIPASTIHRLLECKPGNDGFSFSRNEFNKLEQMFFFIDEASMLDTDLAARFFKALPPESHVLFVGDIYQLPPVGHGAPLRDLITSGRIGYGELTEIRRNSGDIVKGCCALKEGQYFRPNTDTLDLANGRNWLHRPAGKPTRQIDVMLELLSTVPKQFDPIFGIQVICAVNDSKENPISRIQLNKILQPHFNPKNPLTEKAKFAINDKVICIKNAGFELVDMLRPEERTGITDIVANGEIGQVIRIEEKRAIVKLLFPKRYIAVPVSASSSAGDGESNGSSRHFDLAYAITCHKSQGSQMPVVMPMIDASAGANWVASREWHYTGISRAEKICLTIGNWETLMLQSKRVSLQGRKTFLAERLQGVF